MFIEKLFKASLLCSLKAVSKVIIPNPTIEIQKISRFTLTIG